MAKATYRPIEALERGLTVLEQIGEHGTSPAELSDATGINRATIYRILHTLETLGYLTISATDHRYRLARRVRLLSDGYTETAWITQIGIPALGRLFQRVNWPGNLATYNGQGMLVRESTHRFSPLMTHRNMVGRVLPLTSAMGQAFVAFTGAEAAEILVAKFIADRPDDERATREWFCRHLTQVRERGMATIRSSQEAGIGAIAMPVMIDGTARAAVNVIVPDHVIESSTLLAPVAEALRLTIAELAEELAAKSATDLE